MMLVRACRSIVAILISLILLTGCNGGEANPAPEAPRLFFRGSEQFNDSLGQGDIIDPHDRSYVDVYTVTAQPDQILRVAMESQEIDPYLEVTWNDQVIAFDDDSGPDVNAYLAVALPQAGSYQIRATTFTGQSSGRYSLSYSLDAITWRNNEIGELGPGDQQHPEDASWMDVYPIQARAGRSLLVSLTSYDFDAFLQLVDPEGQVIAFDDDQGNRTDALLAFFVERPGLYQIRVNTYDPEGQGDYVMRYTLE